MASRIRSLAASAAVLTLLLAIASREVPNFELATDDAGVARNCHQVELEPFTDGGGVAHA